MNKLIKEWRENVMSQYEQFHTDWVEGELKGKTKYYLKNSEINLRLDSISENFRFCREYFDSNFFDESILVNETDNIRYKNNFANFMNVVYMFQQTLKQFLSIFKQIYDFKDPNLIDIEEETLLKFTKLRKILIHPTSILLSKSDVNLLFFNNIVLNIELLDQNDKLISSSRFMKYFGSNKIECFLNWNFIGNDKGIVGQVFGPDDTKIQFSFLLKKKTKKFFIHFTDEKLIKVFIDILIKLFEKLNNKSNFRKKVFKNKKPSQKIITVLHKEKNNDERKENLKYFDLKISHKLYPSGPSDIFILEQEGYLSKKGIWKKIRKKCQVNSLKIGEILNEVLPPNTHIIIKGILDPRSFDTFKFLDDDWDDILIYYSLMFIFDKDVENYFWEPEWFIHGSKKYWKKDWQLLPIKNDILKDILLF